MKRFCDMKIAAKLLVCFCMVALIAGVLGYIGISKTNEIDHAGTELYEKMTVPMSYLQDMGVALQRIRVNLRDVLLESNPAEKAKYVQTLKSLDAELEKANSTYEKTILSQEMKDAYAVYAKAWLSFQPIRDQLVSLSQAGKEKDAMALLRGDALKSAKEWEASLQQLAEMTAKHAKAKSDRNTETANAAATLMLVVIGVGVLLAVGFGLLLSKVIGNPLRQLTAAAGKIALGDTNVQFNADTKDELGDLGRALRVMVDNTKEQAEAATRIAAGDLAVHVKPKSDADVLSRSLAKVLESLQALVAESKTLTKASGEGRLGARGDVSKFQGGYKEIVQGVNETLDAVTGPLTVAAKYVDRISKGDIPAKITDTYNGDFNEIKNNLNTCIEAISALVTDAAMLSKAVVEGKLAMRADVTKHQGDFREIVAGVNDTLDAVIGPLSVTAKYVDRISKGDIPAKLTDSYNGDFNEIKNNLNTCIDSMNGLLTEMSWMSLQHDLGDIDVFVDEAKFQAAYQVMAKCVNDMVKGHISVKRRAMACVAEFGKGNFEAPLEKFPGKKAFLNDTIEQVRVNLKALIADASMLSKAAVEGKLATRADATKHQGDFRKIVQGVNETLDAVIGPLTVAAKYVDRISKGDIPAKITDKYNGDFDEIKYNLNTCIDAVNMLVADAGMLSKAAVEGKLATRADATKHGGDFRKVVEGVNQTLDAVIGPLTVAAKYVERISKGDIPAKITDSYNGDFNEIKNHLNNCVDIMNNLLAEASRVMAAAAEGNLDERANADLFIGGWKKLVVGINDIVTNIVNPLMVTAECVEKVSKGIIPPEITDTYKGQYNLIKNNLNAVAKMMRQLVAETDKIIRAAADGELDKRADTALFVGGWNKLVAGVNDTITNIVNPLMATATYLDRISKGEIPAKITDDYKGQYNIIKSNLNTCIEAVNALVADAAMLSKAAVEGRLQTRADATKHGGDFRKIVEGVNQALDSVIGPINEAAQVLERVAAKDLTARVKGDYKGDLAKIKDALNSATQNLDDALSEVACGSEQVASAAGQISAGSQSLSQGASEQASSLEEVSSSLQEMASMTKQNAANAKEARSLSDNARGSADKGVESMKRLSRAIDKIKESSDATAKIVKTIDEIAFQTNLLALNAAVEAARAGDAGKGFAVVAEEVRNLAMRSADAAKNTANLIEESVRNAEGGVAINQEVLKDLAEINGQVNKVREVMAEIAAASDQQTQGVSQVNTAVEQMNQVTQQTAANAEESASAAEELSGQAEEMKSMVGNFTLSAATSSPSRGSSRVPHKISVMPARPAAVPKKGESHVAKPKGGLHPENGDAAKLIPFGDMDDEVLKEF